MSLCRSCRSPSSQFELRPLELKLPEVAGPVLYSALARAAVLRCRGPLYSHSQQVRDRCGTDWRDNVAGQREDCLPE